MNLPNVLAFLTLVIALPINLYVALKLWRLVRLSPTILVLRERALVATALTVIVAVFTAIFLNNDVVPPPLGTVETKWITRLAVLVMSVLPAVYWLRLYRHGGDAND
jgi:hypothetical protein